MSVALAKQALASGNGPGLMAISTVSWQTANHMLPYVKLIYT